MNKEVCLHIVADKRTEGSGGEEGEEGLCPIVPKKRTMTKAAKVVSRYSSRREESLSPKKEKWEKAES